MGASTTSTLRERVQLTSLASALSSSRSRTLTESVDFTDVDPWSRIGHRALKQELRDLLRHLGIRLPNVSRVGIQRDAYAAVAQAIRDDADG